MILAPVALGGALYGIWSCIYKILCPHEDPILGVFLQIQTAISTGFGLAMHHVMIFKATKTAETLTAFNGFVATYFGKHQLSQRTGTVKL